MLPIQHLASLLSLSEGGCRSLFHPPVVLPSVPTSALHMHNNYLTNSKQILSLFGCMSMEVSSSCLSPSCGCRPWPLSRPGVWIGLPPAVGQPAGWPVEPKYHSILYDIHGECGKCSRVLPGRRAELPGQREGVPKRNGCPPNLRSQGDCHWGKVIYNMIYCPVRYILSLGTFSC